MALTFTLVLTLALQIVVPVLLLAFGLLALRVAPRPGSPKATAWFMAGVNFTLDGALALVHSLLAAVAAWQGQGTWFYDAYVRATPVGNDARNLLVLGFAAGLAWTYFVGRPPLSRRAIVAGACALVLVGALVGLAEPPLQAQHVAPHLTLMSLFGAATAILFFAALYRGMLRDGVDWLLWTALALYAAQEALSSNIQTVLAWAGLGGGWAPPARSVMWVGLVAACVMLACSLRRLALARTGSDVPGLMERIRG